MITIYDWFVYELTIKERYQLIKEAGFDGVYYGGVNWRTRGWTLLSAESWIGCWSKTRLRPIQMSSQYGIYKEE